MKKHMIAPNVVLIPDEDGLYREATITWEKVNKIGSDTYVIVGDEDEDTFETLVAE